MPGKTTSRDDLTGAMDFEAAAIVTAELDLDEPELRQDPDLPRIPGYVVVRRLGGGGGGEVFWAMHERSSRPVALKRFNERIGETPEAKRAWRELDVLEQLRLPALPRLIDHGAHDGRMYLATEYVDGLPLLDYCEHHALDRTARVELLARIADAVQSLHEQGVIHRDIKPSNILVEDVDATADAPGGRGRPMLVDLGVAMLLSRDVEQTLTVEGAPVGSPAFMAPEQARGEKHSISTRSDVYGLGATAYLVLTGDTPHDMEATLHEAIRRVGNDEPREPRALKPDLPKPLAAVLAKCVRRKPADRYESTAALAGDLRRWLKGEPVEAGSPSIPQRLGRLIVRHPVTVTVAACVAFIGLTLVATYTAVWHLNARPHSLEMPTADKSRARLVSISGRTLYEWDVGSQSHILGADVVERPAEYGGGKVAVIGFPWYPARPELDGRLCIFALDNPETPIWQSGIGPPQIEMPAPISQIEGDRFVIQRLIVADVFAESPGPEIIAAHQHFPHSAALIRIYGLNGDVLYEVWHDGALNGLIWLPQDELIIAGGLNSEATWAERGRPDLRGVARPLVVFALRPQFQALHRTWVRSPGGLGTFAALWYRCVTPLSATAAITMQELELTDDRDPQPGIFRLSLRSRANENVGVGLRINASGEVVMSEPTDVYVQDPSLPDAYSFDLGPLPPIVDHESIRRRTTPPS